jgi:hypothetical protein
MIGYYAGVKGLLGLQQEPTRASPPPSETETAQPEIENPPETETDSPESISSTDQPQDPDPGVVIIDDFESGSLSPAWKDVFDSSNVGTDAGRSVFTVRPAAVFDGQYVLAGDRTPYSEGGSTITRDDFVIESEEATIIFHAELGETYNEPGRPNRVDFRGPDGEIAIRVTQRLDRAANNIGVISDESLAGPVTVELRNISFQDQQIREIAVDSEIVDTNVEFNSDTEVSSIDMVVIEQGHWRQENNIRVDDIRYSV